MASVQATFKAIKDKIEIVTAEQVEERLQYVANYAIVVSPVDTGAYVESFSLGRAGFSGGRMKKSDARAKSINPEATRQVARSNLYQDIQGLNIKQMLEAGNAKFTLRNRAPHARDVENGENWDKDGYHVFRKIRSKFR
jgi:hypothetical protein